VTGVSITADKTVLEIGHTSEITAVVAGDNKNLTWYVNDIENGNAVYGTITRNSPVTYTAPDSLPAAPTISIVAVSDEDETIADTCSIDLEFTKIFVKSDVGNDNTATGSVNLPAKTITKGLTLAEAGMTVLVFPGLYDVHNGELFPLEIPRDVTLVGMDWETCIVLGHHNDDYYETVLMDDPGASFRKFTLEMGEPEEEEWDVAIRVRDDDQLVDSIRVFERGDYSVLRTGGAHNTIIQNCYFVVSDGETRYRAFEIAGASDNLIIRDCTATGFNEGIFVNGMQEPLIEGCNLTGNNYGVGMWYEIPTSNPNPDLGGGARGSSGGNDLSGNITCGINNTTSNSIYAKFNTWDNDPPIEGEDYCNNGTGDVITQ
jgi:parallel beta-helix repeat protein